MAVQRTYMSGNPQPGLFGRGWHLTLYDRLLTLDGAGLRLILADGLSYRFVPTGASEWQNLTEPFFRGAVLTRLPGTFDFQMRFKDGTVHRYAFAPAFTNVAFLAAITDRTGNTVSLTREAVGPGQMRLTQLVDTAGRVLTVTSDAAGRITGAPGSRARPAARRHERLAACCRKC